MRDFLVGPCQQGASKQPQQVSLESSGSSLPNRTLYLAQELVRVLPPPPDNVPSPQNMAWTQPSFPLLSCWMACQNVFEAYWKSSQTWGFVSTTADRYWPSNTCLLLQETAGPNKPGKLPSSAWWWVVNHQREMLHRKYKITDSRWKWEKRTPSVVVRYLHYDETKLQRFWYWFISHGIHSFYNKQSVSHHFWTPTVTVPVSAPADGTNGSIVSLCLDKATVAC